MQKCWIYNGYQWVSADLADGTVYAPGYYYIEPSAPNFNLPADYKAPPTFDKNGKRIEYGKNGCPKGRDLSTFKCPCHFPKCVDLSNL